MAVPMPTQSNMAASMPKHEPQSSPNDEDDEVDPVEEMIKKTGCIELHYEVQYCMAEHQDWRKCQEDVQKFRKCMADYALREAKAKRESKS